MYGMKIVLIGRGNVGWHATTVGEPSPHGAAYTATGSSSGGSLQDYLKEAPEGTPIYDAEEADINAFTDFVVRGPMVKASLDKGEIHRFSQADKECLLGMLPALGGEFQAIGVLAMAGISSLDYVAVDVYIQMLREKVPGVKVGKVVKSAVEWEQGS
jgi:hypothetical protein